MPADANTPNDAAGAPHARGDDGTPAALGPPSIWAPWRMKYLEGIDQGPEGLSDDAPEAAPAPAPPKKPTHPSFLRGYWETPEDDAKNHIIVRTDHGMILLNAYPYNNGHLLIALAEPRPTLAEYGPEQRAAFWSMIETGTALIERALEPGGVNIGINQGAAAGAGVPQHLHAHIVPRWAGDVNFMTAIGGIRVVPSSLDAMADRYAAVAQELRIEGAVVRG